MKVEIEEVNSVEKKVTITIPKESVMNELDSAYKDLSKKVKIKGFRQGRVPRNILKRHYESQVEGDVATRLVNDSCFKTLEEHDIIPVSQPIIDNGGLQEGKEFTYSAKVEVKPEIEVQGYVGMELSRERLDVSKEDIDKKLSELQQSNAQLEEVDSPRAIESGDFVVVDYEGFLGGEPIKEGSVRDHLLELGSGSFFPEFEEQLLGLKKGEEKEIQVTLPTEYSKEEWAGKEILFKVKIKEIKAKIIPDLNDDFAKDLGECETLEELEKRLRESLELQEKRRIESDIREKVLDRLVEINAFEIPPSLVDQHLRYMTNEMQMRLAFQGVTMEQAGLSLDDFKERYESQAEKEVRGSLLLAEIAEKESIAVSEKETGDKIDEIAAGAGQKAEDVRNYYREKNAREKLRSGLVTEKTLDFIIQKARIEEVERERK